MKTRTAQIIILLLLSFAISVGCLGWIKSSLISFVLALTVFIIWALSGPTKENKYVSLVAFLFICNLANAQTYHYDLIADSHLTHYIKEQHLDSLENRCGSFVVSDTLISKYEEAKSAINYQISLKTLDLECRCFYYFTANKDLVVVNEVKSYIIVAKINPDTIKMRTYYLKEFRKP